LCITEFKFINKAKVAILSSRTFGIFETELVQGLRGKKIASVEV
jgi:hypothetical protein